jgi:hypothetical protein
MFQFTRYIFVLVVLTFISTALMADFDSDSDFSVFVKGGGTFVNPID